MEAFLVSIAVVAVGEIGDKTQLLALMLAARFRQPVPIVAGILVATLANHALAGLVGDLGPHARARAMLRWLRRAVVLRGRAWALKPDTLDDDEPRRRSSAAAYSA